MGITLKNLKLNLLQLQVIKRKKKMKSKLMLCAVLFLSTYSKAVEQVNYSYTINKITNKTGQDISLAIGPAKWINKYTDQQK